MPTTLPLRTAPTPPPSIPFFTEVVLGARSLGGEGIIGCQSVGGVDDGFVALRANRWLRLILADGEGTGGRRGDSNLLLENKSAFNGTIESI